MSGTLTVEGLALVFEAVLHVDIRDRAAPYGDEHRDGRQRYGVLVLEDDVRLQRTCAGFYDLVAYDLSARDGAVETSSRCKSPSGRDEAAGGSRQRPRAGRRVP